MLLFPHPFLSCIIIFAIFAFVLFSSIIPLLFSFVPPRVYNHFHCFQPRGAEGKELLLLVVLSTYECMGYVYMCIDITAYAAGEGKKGRGGGGGGGGGGTAAGTTTTKELDVMQLQADMFWWFAKMDCYQSLVSGCPLV